MFRCWSAFLLYGLVLSAGAGAHPLLLDNGMSDASSSSIAPRASSYMLNFVSAYKASAKNLPKGHIRVKAELTLFHTQGLNSRMYSIADGNWPCSACHPQILENVYPALAKKHVRQSKYTLEEHLVRIENERKGLRLVGQLLDHGKGADDSNWTIVRDMRVTSSGHRRHLIRNIIYAQRGALTHSTCLARYQKAYDAALRRMKWYVENKHILHCDVNVNNVLFDKNLDDAQLVDWGSWVYRTTWNPEETKTAKSIAHMTEEFITMGPARCAEILSH